MRKVTVLVTSSGSGPGVAVIKALRRQTDLDLKIVAVDADRLSAGLYLVDAHHLVPYAMEPDFVKEILRICKNEKVDIVIPIFDTETPVFAERVKKFARKGVQVLVNSPEVIEVCNDKLITSHMCQRRHIPTPRIYVRDEIASNEVIFPVILKPRKGVGSRGIQVVRDTGEFDKCKPIPEEVLVQEYIDGQEFTVDVLLDVSGDIITMVPRKRLATRDGQMVKGCTSKDERILRYCEEVCRQFKLRHSVCIQIKVWNDELYLIEINPRYGTGISLSIGAGVNIPLLQIKSVLGLRITEEERDFKDRYYMMSYWEEVFRSEEELIGLSG